MSTTATAHTTPVNPAPITASKTEASDKAKAKAHNMVDKAAEKTQELESKLRDHASQASEKIEASQEAAQAQIEQTMEKVERFVKERPIAAAGIAFAAGVVATSILRR